MWMWSRWTTDGKCSGAIERGCVGWLVGWGGEGGGGWEGGRGEGGGGGGGGEGSQWQICVDCLLTHATAAAAITGANE